MTSCHSRPTTSPFSVGSPALDLSFSFSFSHLRPSKLPEEPKRALRVTMRIKKSMKPAPEWQLAADENAHSDRIVVDVG